MKKLSVADFFCGAGGFSEGFSQAGFKVIFALDNWKPAISTHKLNHPSCHAILKDILELDSPEKIDEVVPDTDVIIGSPPCISFSNSNKSGKADKKLGIQLIKSFLRIIAWKKKKGVLKYWIMENVPNSAKHTKEIYTWKELGLPGKGLDLKVPNRLLMNSADYGVPQLRKRFISGDFPIPAKTTEEKDYLKISCVLKSLGNPLNNEKEKISDPIYNFSINVKNLSDHYYDNRIADFEWKRSKELKLDHGYMGKMAFPENIHKPCRTVMATMSASTRESLIFLSFTPKGRKNGYRLPTIREASCYMSFPITYQFEGAGDGAKYRLIGNAVCPKLSYELAKEILKNEKINIKKTNDWKEGKKATNNLNGSKRKLKIRTDRRFDSKFSGHIPNLKLRNYRVSMENTNSDFKKGKIRWEGILHHGTGKEAKKLQSKSKIVKALIENTKEFQTLKKDVIALIKKYNLSHYQLHHNFIKNNEKINPEKILKELRKIIDKSYPEKEFKDVEINHRLAGLNIGNGSMPIRIAVALYVTSLFIEKLTISKD